MPETCSDALAASPGPVSPAELARLLPDAPVLLNDQTGSAGIGIAYYRRRRSEFRTPPLRNHLIMVNLGPPARLFQSYRGHSREVGLLNGDMTLLPAGEANHWRWGQGTDLLHLYLRPEFLVDIAESAGLDAGRIEIVYRASARDLQIQHLGGVLLAEARSAGLGGPLFVESLANLLALHLLRHHSTLAPALAPPPGGLSAADLRRVIAFIEDNLENDLSLAHLAQAVSLSPFHFAHRFKQTMGVSPHQYVICRRVEEARRRLEAGGTTTIGQAASLAGFSSQSQLTFHFRRLLGVTPKAILQERKNFERKNLSKPRKIPTDTGP